jgi:DNA-directed RNA polymerase specialized sigma24 family protein
MYEDTFMTAREFLATVREAAQRIEVLERRIAYRQELGEDAVDLEAELETENREKLTRANAVMDAISRLRKADQQTVMMKRYVDLKSWEEIAADMDIGIREVQKLHGRALPFLDELLGGGSDEVHSA